MKGNMGWALSVGFSILLSGCVLDEGVKESSSISDVQPPPIEGLLGDRSVLCLRDRVEERKKKIEALYRKGDKSSSIEMLLLASCEPNLTPGFLKVALNRVSAYEWPAGYNNFFDLMNDQSIAIEALSEQNKALRVRMNKAIEAITDIEQEIDSREQESPESER